MRIFIAITVLAVGVLAGWSQLRPDDDTTRTNEELKQEADPEAPPKTGPAVKDLEAGLDQLLRELILSKTFRADPPEIQRRLETLMERFLPCEEPLRKEIATLTSLALPRQMNRFAPKEEIRVLPPLAIQAIEARAENLAKSLREMMKDPNARHEGTLQGGGGDFPIPEGYTRVSWRMMGSYEYEEGMTLPEHIKALDGLKVSAAGFMLGLDGDQDIHEFLLVESQWSCCFGEIPELHELFVIRVPESAPGIDLTASRIVVSGRLEVGEEVEEGFVTSVYRIIADQVVDLRR